MNATEELRRMLDERGIEWHEVGGVTFFGTSGYDTCYSASEPECGIALDPLTPEQAIAATVGGETCHVKAVKKMGDLFGFSLSCGHSMVNPFNDHPDYCPWCGRRVVE